MVGDISRESFTDQFYVIYKNRDGCDSLDITIRSNNLIIF